MEWRGEYEENINFISDNDVMCLLTCRTYVTQDSYGQYKQEKIVYANKKDYIKKKDAYNAYLVYEINKDACTFESDLKYQNIQYKKVELSKDEKEKVPEALIKYNLYEGEKQLGIAVYLGEETVYISSYDQYDGSPVYIAKMKKITNKS